MILTGLPLTIAVVGLVVCVRVSLRRMRSPGAARRLFGSVALVLSVLLIWLFFWAILPLFFMQPSADHFQKLTDAAKAGDANEARSVLQAYPDLSMKPQIEQVLDVGVRYSSAALVSYALDHGADPNRSSLVNFGAPIFLAMASPGGEEIAKLLVERGANVNAEADQGNDTPLTDAAGRGYASLVDDLLAHHADVRKRRRDGTTALHRAAERGYTAICLRLLAAGASANDKTNAGLTAADYAIKAHHQDTADRIRLKANSSKP